MENFPNSLTILDDMGDSNRLPEVDELYSRRRQCNTNINSWRHTITDLSTKARDNTAVNYITWNSSHILNIRVQDKLKVDSNL